MLIALLGYSHNSFRTNAHKFNPNKTCAGEMEDVYEDEHKDVIANYANKHGIYHIMGEMLKDLIVNRPADPVQFLSKSVLKVPSKWPL
jgi:hypothetical protein